MKRDDDRVWLLVKGYCHYGFLRSGRNDLGWLGAKTLGRSLGGSTMLGEWDDTTVYRLKGCIQTYMGASIPVISSLT